MLWSLIPPCYEIWAVTGLRNNLQYFQITSLRKMPSQGSAL
jgi:hypothetical protein